MKTALALLTSALLIGGAVAPPGAAVPQAPAAVVEAPAAVEAPAVPSAVDASMLNFNPGYIISDALFYDGNAMTVDQVQAFLQSKSAPCTAGYTCAYQGVMRTPSMPAQAGRCGAFTGSASESVASVITRVGQACGISQRVLLVLIQKEQRLITSRAPTQRMYDKATGFACPDTAPCDEAFSGFFYQVWYAARQFRIYQSNPTAFNHQPGRVNYVRFHPNAACGTEAVWIENWATAGLYNYTPYQPNKSALRNMYGEGDGCGSYGNRNFFSIYTDWFGPTTPTSPIAALHAASGGDGGVLGPVQGGVETFIGNGNGWGQRFLNGSVMWSNNYGTWAVMNGPIRDEYFAKGGPAGGYGWPLAAQVCSGGVCTQAFQGGVIPGQIKAYHTASGGDAGPLGPPQSGLEAFPVRGGGLGQRFLNGSVMWSNSFGAFAIMNGAIRNEYFGRGGPGGVYGWPIAEQVCTDSGCTQAFQGGTLPGPIAALHASLGGDAGELGPAQSGIETFSGRGGGTGQRFLNGSVMSSPTAGTWAIMNGPIRNEYFGRGGPSGVLGWPTGAQVCTDGVCTQTFQGGTIPSGINLLHASMGGNAGALGPAQSGVETFSGRGGGTGQRFLNGSIMSSPTAGTWAIMNGSIRNEYFGRGGPSGIYGWPTGAQDCSSGVCTQLFQGGEIGANAIDRLHVSLGGNAGALGPAQSGVETFSGRGGGTGQRFLNGSIMSSPTAGTWAIMNGPIRNEYFARGGPSGVLGWPIAAEDCTSGVCVQQFQGGSIPGPIAVYHGTIGGNSGALGPAQSGIETFTGSGGGIGQRFLNGSIMSSPTAGTWEIMNGPIRNEYFARGGPSGVYGWPTAAPVCASGTCTQQFQGGVLTAAG